MTLSTLRDMLLWCTVINFAFLGFWFLMMQALRPWVYTLWSRWFPLSREQFDILNFGGMMLYKLLIVVFNLVPYIALWIVGNAVTP